MQVKALLVIAISASAYVAAAKRAGYSVTSIDGFADKETFALADVALVVEYDAQGFNAKSLLDAVKSLVPDHYCGCIYGSGFEMQADLLDAISQHIPILGNAAEVVKRVKSPQVFFETLDACNIAHPKLLDDVQKKTDVDVLVKTVGGSGGSHIQLLKQSELNQQALIENGDVSHYSQEYIDGLSVSVLFLAGLQHVERHNQIKAPVLVVGFNEQWLSPGDGQPFRFGGAVSGVDINTAVKELLSQAAIGVTNAFGLKGLNSLDAIISDNKVYVLEVNPRLSATFALYAEDWLSNKQVDLINLHVQICRYQYGVANNNEALDYINQKIQKLAESDVKNQIDISEHRAFAVVYAEKDFLINHHFNWPDWVVDTPLIMRQSIKKTMYHQFEKGNPICTVITSGINVKAAKLETQTKMQWLQLQLKQAETLNLT